jgi:hypothetical protein
VDAVVADKVEDAAETVVVEVVVAEVEVVEAVVAELSSLLKQPTVMLACGLRGLHTRFAGRWWWSCWHADRPPP